MVISSALWVGAVRSPISNEQLVEPIGALQFHKVGLRLSWCEVQRVDGDRQRQRRQVRRTLLKMNSRRSVKGFAIGGEASARRMLQQRRAMQPLWLWGMGMGFLDLNKPHPELATAWDLWDR